MFSSMGGDMDELPDDSRVTRPGALERPRIVLAPDASGFLADRIRRQHCDELETRPMPALTRELLEQL